MKLLWLTSSSITRLDDGWYSPMASARYRLAIPAHTLLTMGHEVTVITVAELERNPDAVSGFGKGFDVVIFSKVFHPLTLQLVVTASKNGARTLFDLCDNHFDESQRGKMLRLLLLRVDDIVCSTIGMSELIAEETGRTAFVIGDPVEGPHGALKEKPSEDVFRLAWFGHPVNLDTLQAQLPALSELARTMPLSLTVITDAASGFAIFADRFNRHAKSRMVLHFVPWSLSATWQELALCDAVIIPSFVDNERKSVKSANRVVESLQAARAVIANPLPSYKEFANWCWIGDNLVDGVIWTAKNYDESLKRAQEGQNYVQNHFTASEIAAHWQRVFQRVTFVEKSA